MKSIVIPLTTLMTVGGQTNVHVADTATLFLYLRRFDDSGTYIEEFTGNNLGGGAWEFTVPEGNYQLWKSAYPDTTPSNRIDKWHGGASKYRRIQDEEDPKYVKVSGDTMTGHLNMNDAGFIIAPKDPTGDNHVGDRSFNDSRYVLKSDNNFWQISSNIIMVDANGPDITGKYYNTIQEAIDYANTQSPSAANRFAIIIMPHKNKGAGYSENITLQAYVDLIGIGLVRITGSLSGGNANTRLENLFWTYDGNLTIQSVKALNSIFRVYQSIVNGGRALTIEGLRAFNCGFYSWSGSAGSVISNGTNVFINCHVNAEFNKHGSDKGEIYSLGDVTIDYLF